MLLVRVDFELQLLNGLIQCRDLPISLVLDISYLVVDDIQGFLIDALKLIEVLDIERGLFFLFHQR